MNRFRFVGTNGNGNNAIASSCRDSKYNRGDDKLIKRKKETKENERKETKKKI